MPKAPRQKTTSERVASKHPYAKDKQHTPAPPEIVDEKYTSGDFTLIGSDDVRFRVDSSVLFVASPVFGEAGELSSGDKVVHLTDPDFETAAVVRAFLDFVLKFKFNFKTRRSYNCRTDIPGDALPLKTLSPVISLALFMHKYDCGLELMRLQYAYSKESPAYLNPSHSCDLFTLGALINSVNKCVDAIQEDEEMFVSVASNTNDSGNLFMDKAALIPSNLPEVYKNAIPSRYLEALAKSWKESSKGRRRKEHSRKEWARRFRLEMINAAFKADSETTSESSSDSSSDSSFDSSSNSSSDSSFDSSSESSSDTSSEA